MIPDRAPALSRDEQAVETVARAMWRASHDRTPWTNALEDEQDDYRRMAAAAIAALPPSPAEEAVKRVEALAEEWEAEAQRHDDAEPLTTDGLHRMILAAKHCRAHARDLRAALASLAPAPQAEEAVIVWRVTR